jgi:hypothetical protein
VTQLSELFGQKYGVPLEEVAKVQGYGDNLRSLFTSSKRFSIYGTQIAQEFYVALFQAVIPSFDPSQASPIQYRIKRPWKVDGNLLRVLESEGAEEIPSRQAKRISKYQPILISEIRSVNDLESALVEIIKSLITDHPRQFVTIAALGQKFLYCYRQPIRVIVRSTCPDMKLIDLLQTIPNLHVQKVNNEWQITMEI